MLLMMINLLLIVVMVMVMMYIIIMTINVTIFMVGSMVHLKIVSQRSVIFCGGNRPYPMHSMCDIAFNILCKDSIISYFHNHSLVVQTNDIIKLELRGQRDKFSPLNRRDLKKFDSIA